jgi:hypothetical protein
MTQNIVILITVPTYLSQCTRVMQSCVVKQTEDVSIALPVLPITSEQTKKHIVNINNKLKKC